MSANDLLNDSVKGVLNTLMSKLKERDDTIERLESRINMTITHTVELIDKVDTLEKDNSVLRVLCHELEKQLDDSNNRLKLHMVETNTKYNKTTNAIKKNFMSISINNFCRGCGPGYVTPPFYGRVYYIEGMNGVHDVEKEKESRLRQAIDYHKTKIDPKHDGFQRIMGLSEAIKELEDEMLLLRT